MGISGADRILAFNMSVPFSVLTGRRYARDTLLDRTYATFNANRNRDGDNSWQTGVGGTLLEGRNLSYSVTQGRSSTNGYSGSASASWQATYGTLGVDITTIAISMTITGNFPAAWSVMRMVLRLANRWAIPMS